MSNITEKVKEELKVARETCEVSGDNSQECVAAWDTVQEVASQPEQPKPKNSLEVYCDANPEADECRLYED